jgi:hypothetical protein
MIDILKHGSRQVGTHQEQRDGPCLDLSNVRNDNETELFRFTFCLSNVKKKNCVLRFVRAKREIFAKITLERKKFRLRSTFRCSNVTKKSLCFTFRPSEM